MPQRRSPRESAESACRQKAGARWLATRTDRKFNHFLYHIAVLDENNHGLRSISSFIPAANKLRCFSFIMLNASL